MFIVLPVYLILYFYLIEKLNVKNSWYIYIIPIFGYALVAGMQYGVGTDYFSYVDIFNSDSKVEQYNNAGEFLFYYTVKLLKFFQLPSQSLFLFISLIQAILFFGFIKLIKREGFSSIFFIFLFFVLTNIYQNQLNGIRQFVAVLLLPLFLFSLDRRRVVTALLLLVAGSLFHTSFIIFSIFLVFLYVRKFSVYSCLICFFISPILYFYLTGALKELLDFLSVGYAYYLDTEVASGKKGFWYITKLYYFPMFIVFYYIWWKERNIKRITLMNSTFFNTSIFIFSCTYWIFLSVNEIAILSRISYYFTFFYIFPAYFIMAHLYNRRNAFGFLILVGYLVVPYILKVTLLAKAEFYYRSFVFN